MLFKMPNFTICPHASQNGNWYCCMDDLHSCNYLCLLNDYYKVCPNISQKQKIPMSCYDCKHSENECRLRPNINLCNKT